RTIVGTISKLHEGGNGRFMLIPNNKALPRFMCPSNTKEALNLEDDDDTAGTLYRAEYVYGSWSDSNRWPPCVRVTRLCGSCNVEDETKALLVEHGVDHGEFPPAVLREVDLAVKSGRFFQSSSATSEGEMGWKPTEEMCRGRRDYRSHRVFTIDPTTARDLDDALHVTQLPDGRVEIGVHIADVSHFVQPSSAVDEEALRRATTVYLVDRVIPMLPRPLCEIACSLNENVERLAFSVVWRMNMDGTLSKKKGSAEKCKEDDIWYGRTVIKSCARLDYATAQNIIDNKVAAANGESEVDETLWPKSRQPTGGHTIAEVAADVRLMHQVAMKRRKLRFENGALALNGIKLTFQLEDDGETPKLCAPYPIRDSNRLIEEYMLLANFLVAQRLITHAKGRALLRQHSPPLEAGMQNVVDVSKESFDFDIDITSSKTLQESLSRLSRTCDDELVIQCVTESLMTPMRPAEYIAAGEVNDEDWQHFALNIPYYTHFTSPIRRYADVIVHRLLQATLDDAVSEFPQTQQEIHSAADQCNDKRMASKKAQERSDRVFLSLYLKEHPIASVLGVCLGIGEKTFTVFVPSLGMSTRVFLQEHEDVFDMNT
ncbi:ribonuclease, partial [Thalassiosira pseudonana CCMP1335]